MLGSHQTDQMLEELRKARTAADFKAIYEKYAKLSYYQHVGLVTKNTDFLTQGYLDNWIEAGGSLLHSSALDAHPELRDFLFKVQDIDVSIAKKILDLKL